MSLRKFWHRILSLILLPLAALFGAYRVGGDAYIDPSVVVVDSFDGWGTSLCWWANVVGGYANRTNYADLAFTKLKLNIVRYNIGGGENPGLPNTLQYRARMPGFESPSGAWNWNADTNQRWMLKAALARGVTRVEAFANSPPYWMTVSGSVAGSVDGTSNNLQPGYETAFARYVATVVSNLTVLDSIHFDTVTAVNEPTASWWRLGNNQEGCHISPDQQGRLINLLRTQLATAEPAVGIASSEDNDEQSSINSVNSYNATTVSHLDRIVTHTYGANNPTGLRSLAASLHKPLWVSEYGDGDATGMTMARRIRDDLAQMWARAWVYWQVVDNAGGWGFIRNPLDDSRDTSITYNKKFWVMGQFSEFIPPGSQILNSPDGNSLVAYDRVKETLIVVAVNDSATALNTTYDLSAFATLPARVTRYRTSATESQTPGNLPLVGNRFKTSLPAQSVSTYILTNTAPRNPVPVPSAWYPLDGNPQDASPARNDGSAVGAVTYTTAKLGTQSAHFDGVSSYIQIPALAANHFTVACWVKTTAIGGTGQWWNGKGLIDGEVSGPADDWGLVLLGAKAGFGIGNPDTTIVSTRTINNGQWHHVAATRDTVSGEMRIYIDGALDAAGFGPVGPKNAPPSLHVGGLQAGYAGGFLNGSIDDVQIIGRVLAPAEISSLMNHPPVIAPVRNQSILGGALLTLTNSATDPDLPAQSLSWSASGLPDGAQLDATSGALNWRAPVLPFPTTNSVMMTVHDNGTPPMSASMTVTILVPPPKPPSLTLGFLDKTGGIALFVAGDRGPDYFLDATTNLTPPIAWTALLTNLAPAQFPIQWSRTNSGPQPQEYYRVRLGP